MTMPALRDNSQLLEYLNSLAVRLHSAGNTEVASDVETAARFALGSPSEFLDEAQRALTNVRSQCPAILNATDVADLDMVLQQIRTAFDRVGGA